MTMTDPIADMLTRIRNGYKAKFRKVDIPASNLKKEIARILLEEMYIGNYKLIEDDWQGIIRVYLKYDAKENIPIVGLKRISKPGKRVYATKDKIPRVRNGLGTAIISTSKGIITDRACRQLGIGGEVLCYVW
ncbi:30S ribosomal protein S8 [bacterium]|nr:30S ribosomal protein S8 [bacterium]